MPKTSKITIGIVITVCVLLVILAGYGFYVSFIKPILDNGDEDLNMKIPDKVTMRNCCSTSKSSEAAYCYGGWNAENLDGPKWSKNKCDKAAVFLDKCDEQYKDDEITC